MASSSVGTYCYDIALSKVQFSSDTNQFSPNNVRRLFISGDGVLVQLFVNTGTGIYKKGFFNPSKAFDCFCDKGYKPIVQCLVDLVCSNLEEIVFCTQSQSGTKLNQAELNLTALLKGYSGSLNPDLAKSLLGRFPRLREITMFNGTIEGVVEISGSETFRDYSKPFSDCISDKKLLYVQTLSNAEWYKHHRLRPQHYMLDIQGGKLSTYFEKVKSKLESSDKESRIAEMNAKRFGEKQKTVDTYNNYATGMLICLKKYAQSSKKVDIEATRLLVGLSAPTGLDQFGLSKDVVDVLSRASVDSSVKEMSEKYEVLTASLAKLSETCYLYALEMFFEAVRSYKERQTTLKVKSRDFDCSKIKVPTGVSGYFDVEELLGCKFSESVNVKVAMAHLLAYTCKLNIPLSQIKDKSMYEVEYWQGILSRKETK